MANPLSVGVGTGGGDLPPGGVRILTARDKSGNVIKTYTLYRTNRPYVEDLADAYNAGIDATAKANGAQWFVTETGELKLGYTDRSIHENRKRAESARETERARYLRFQLEHARQPDEPID